MKKLNHSRLYFEKLGIVLRKLNLNQIDSLANALLKIRKNNGRVFFIGVGGSAGNCSHAVNDFRKLCEINCYTPIDNVSELTARINDEGWETSFSNWLKVSKLNNKDAIFVLSVGGGNIQKKVSINIVQAIKFSKIKKAKIFGIVGRDGGYTKKNGDEVIVVPTVEKKYVTPFSESMHSVIWHCLVSHPKLQVKKMKW
tara:strand:- start:2041 stop:2634 length:594 start_codon:yes stop_codon:yes gene_type:complete